MLYDWNTTDANTGVKVSAMVASDLATLSQSGFNVVHLYLWDRTILIDDSSPNNPDTAGFCSAASDAAPCSNGNPETSPDATGQQGALWSNLDQFLAAAESDGLYVMLEFVNGQMLDAIRDNSSTCSAIEQNFTTNWAKYFIDYFEANHGNIIAWGLNWSWTPNGQYACTNTVWAQAYNFVKSEAQANYPSRPAQAMVGVALGLDPVDPNNLSSYPTDVVPRNTGYIYNWTWNVSPPSYGSQQMALQMYTVLGNVEPDYFLLGGYNANSGDLYSALYNLENTAVSGGRTIPASKIVFSEFGGSSGLTEASTSRTLLPAGWYAYASLGDKQIPITSRAGQSQWVQNAVCAFQAAGVAKQAYWNMYDPYTYWSSPSWNENNYNWLAMQGFWGLITEDTATYKNAWSTLTSYYNNTLSCSAPSSAAPVLEVNLDAVYYTVNQPIGFYWTVTDGSSLTLSQGHGGSYSCMYGGVVSSNGLDGSCAYTVANGFSSTGNQTITMTAYTDSAGSPAFKSYTVPVGAGPVISAITDSNYGTYITSNSIIVVWGEGFAIHGGNTIQLYNNSTGLNYWLYETDGMYYADNFSYYQINAALGGVPPAGSYTVYEGNPFTGTPSNGYALTIN